MRWRQGRRSSHVEDRRGQRPGRKAALGGGGLVLVIGVAIVMALMGEDPTALLEAAAGSSAAPSAPATMSTEESELADFVSVVLADTEDTWTSILQPRGIVYQPPTLILFRDEVRSACGLSSAAVGPFYCPGDRQVYIDLSFFQDLDERFGAPGDFAQAYVIAHEVGHHMQTLLGISARLRAQKRGMAEAQANQLSVRQELQADCFAGVWAHHANRQRQVLEPGDLEEGLQAAASIGDDTLQRRAGARVAPESWTHGSSEQRVRWFRTGFQSGNMDLCNTFAANPL